MREFILTVLSLFFLGVAALLVLNGLQRIIYYGDWPQGLQSLGIGGILAMSVLPDK